MHADVLSIIIKTEERAKEIVENAKSTARAAFNKTVSTEKEKLLAEEIARREKSQNNISNLYAEWESRLAVANANASKQQNKLTEKLNIHKDAMTELVISHIKEKGGM